MKTNWAVLVVAVSLGCVAKESGGAQGPKGDPGPKGDQGAVGLTGAQGVQGPKGDTGPTGDIGPQGAPGASGASGGVCYTVFGTTACGAGFTSAFTGRTLLFYAVGTQGASLAPPICGAETAVLPRGAAGNTATIDHLSTNLSGSGDTVTVNCSICCK